MKMSRAMLLGLAMLGLTAVPVAAKDYKIKLDRPAKVGDRYRTWVTATKKEGLTISKDGTVLRQNDKTEKTTLQGVVSVQKVDKAGKLLKLQLKVEKFVDAKGDELLKKGDVVIAETIEKKTTYRLSEGTLSDDIKKRLSVVLKTKTRDGPSNDEAYGTKYRKKIGDSWKINSQAAGKSLKIAPKAISGSVKLEAVEKFEGHECLRISMKARITEYGGEQLAKQGFEIKSLDFTVALTGLHPTDQKIDVVKGKISMSVDAKVLGVKGAVKGLAMKIVTRVTYEERRTYLK